VGARASTVAVHGPRQVKSGHRVHLRVSGYAGKDVRTLVVRLDDRQCAATAQAETRRRRPHAPVRLGVHGRFIARLTVKRSFPGTHYACAYLVQDQSGPTVASASWRYVTRRR